MAYIESENIKMYPTSHRDVNKDKFANLSTEFNISNLINRLVDKDSFVVKWANSDNIITFNIHGYWFEVKLNSELLSNASNVSNLYAAIQIKTIESGYSDGLPVLSNIKENSITALDDNDNDEFQGIIFANDENYLGVNINYSLHLLTKINDVWVVPENSKVKFTTNETTKSITIDDGEI